MLNTNIYIMHLADLLQTASKTTYSAFKVLVCSLGLEPMTFYPANPMFYHQHINFIIIFTMQQLFSTDVQVKHTVHTSLVAKLGY